MEFDLGPHLRLKKKSEEADLEAAARVGDIVFWLGSHGRNAKGKETVPTLTKVVAEGWRSTYAPDLRLGSIAALGNLGPLAKEAIPSLEAAGTDKYYEAAASAALKRIRGE